MQTLLFILVIALLISLMIAAISLAPWVPTRKRDLERILAFADLKAGDQFVELGSGNGRVSLYISKHSPAQVTGIEFAYPLYVISKVMAWIQSDRKVKFEAKDLFGVDLSNASVIYVFGMPESLKTKVRVKLEKELRPGAKVISYVFPIADWEPTVIDKPAEKELSLYVYAR